MCLDVLTMSALTAFIGHPHNPQTKQMVRAASNSLRITESVIIATTATTVITSVL